MKIWEKLNRYLEDGNIPIDNNRTENIARPFIIGRKNFLFSFTSEVAKAAACLYSVIESAKANGHEPFWYLKYFFECLPYIETEAELRALLLFNLDTQETQPPPD